MIAYELYWVDEIHRDHFIGIVPERRRKTDRITQESVLKWVRTYLNDIADLDFNHIYFVQKELKGEIFI